MRDEKPDHPSLLGRSLPHVWAVVWRLWATLAALEFAYLTFANVTLLTPLLQKIAKSDDILVRYAWAYSLLPGRVVDRNLNVRVEDHNIQFLVALERGSLDVSLHELLRKRFHALRVDADNELDSPDASVGNPIFRVEGASSYGLSVNPDQPAAPLEIGTQCERLRLEARTKGHASPSIEHLDVRARVTSNFIGPLDVLSAEVAPLELEVPDLGWVSAVDGDLPALRGSGDVLLAGERNPDKRWTGNATRPWSAVLTSERLELRPEDRAERARGTVAVHADDATALMPLFVDSPFARSVGNALLGIHSLGAKGAFSIGDVSRFELLHAQAGIAKARGMLSLTHDGPTGAFLVSTGVANLGVRVRSGETRVELFVGNDWLDKHLWRHLP